RAAAAGRAALHAEERAERRLAERTDRVLSDPVEAKRESDGIDGLSLAQRRGGHRGDDDDARARGGQRVERLQADLRLPTAVELDDAVRGPEPAGDLKNWLH